MSLLRLHGFFRRHPLTRRKIAAAWLRFIRWQVRSRLSDEVIVDWVGPTRFAARRGMTGFTSNIYTGLHEAVDMLFVLHFLRAGDVFGDVGANVGSYTVLASGVAGAHTVAFEPDPTTVAKLYRNIALNDLSARVTVIQAAAGAKSGTAHFTRGQDTKNRVAVDADSDVQDVRLTTLDQALAGRTPAMLKLDIEGFEEQALLGAAETLGSDRLQAVLIETVSEAAADRLRARGLNQMYYDPFRRALDPAPQAHKASNQLFVRDADTVSARLREAPAVEILGQRI